MDNNELMHWGVKGMRWGVRQNPKSSKNPTTAKLDRARKKEMRKDVRNRRLLTDDELRKKINRIKLEKELRELTDAEINKGRQNVEDVLVTSGKKVATTVLPGATMYGIKYALTREFNAKDAADYVVPKPKKK